MSALRRIIAAFLALLLFTGQSGYSLTLCYCIQDGHYHFEWPWQKENCCTEETPEEDSKAACEVQSEKASCCAFKVKETRTSISCCSHTTLIIKKTDPATTPTFKKQFSLRLEWAKRLVGQGIASVYYLSGLAQPSPPPHNFALSLFVLNPNVRAHLCVWRN